MPISSLTFCNDFDAILRFLKTILTVKTGRTLPDHSDIG